jgi:predicted DNA-binding helix-hairpin-helix protein
MNFFPVNINSADKTMLSRIPGVGINSVDKIISARRFRKLNWEHLKKIRVALNRAKYFIVCDSAGWEHKDMEPQRIKELILRNSSWKFRKEFHTQLNLFN